MYVPKHFEERDTEVLQALMRSHPLGAWVTVVDDDLTVNHIPFFLDSTRGPHGTLVGHVARGNPIWRSFSDEIPSLVIFQGPQCYITPSWYPSKRAHGKAVPTWNYAVVHARGMPRVIEDRACLLKHVTALSDRHESKMAVPWRVSDVPEDYLASMLKSIVGIEIPIDSVTGKWKASQNRPLPDKLGIIAGLNANGDSDSRRLVALMQRHTARKDDS